jgi:phosphohistidine phosphatase SixA
MVVGHNPGLERLIYRLSRQYESMPTAAIAQFQFQLDDWGDIESTDAELINVWRPKEI